MKKKHQRKTSDDYWINRALKREQESYLIGQELNKKLLEFYQDASADVRKKINDFYTRYAIENKLTFDEAVKIINKSEFKEWEKSLDEYVREYEEQTDPVRAAELKARVDARAYKGRITRLEAVNMQIESAVNVLYFKSLNEMNKGFGKIFETAFLGKTEDLAERFDFTYKQFNEKMIEDVISYPWCGNHFSDRLWKNKENLVFNLRDILSRGLQSGTSLPQMAKEMADKTGQSFKTAYTLVETEATHFHEEANFRAYEGAGIEKYQFWSEHELSVCSTCADLDMEVFDVKDRKIGINAPPIHPRCRCITVEYDPYEKEDYINSGVEPPEDRESWKQWYDREGRKQEENKINKDIEKDKESGIIKVREMATNDEEIKWLPKGEKISLEQYKKLRDYANEKGIALKGFKKSDVDIELTKDVIDDASKLIEKYPELKGSKKKPFTLDLSYNMSNNDFAETNPNALHIVKLNGNAFRNREKLAEEYSKLEQCGWFVKGTDYHSIIKHEMGHLYSDIHNIDSIEIAKKVTGINNNKELISYIEDELSMYASSFENGSEIISEVFAGYDVKNTFAVEFIRRCLE